MVTHNLLNKDLQMDLNNNTLSSLISVHQLLDTY